MLILGMNETADHFTMASSMCWYGHILRLEDGHALRRALVYEVQGQRRKGRLNRTWRKQAEQDSTRVGLSREDAFCRSK